MAKKTARPFSAELLDTLLEGRDLKSGLDSGDLIGDLKKALAERMLDAEMDVHLEPDAESSAGNYRNGTSAKMALTPEGPVELSIPRDRHRIALIRSHYGYDAPNDCCSVRSPMSECRRLRIVPTHYLSRMAT